jgi:hypothetical protein
MDETDAELEFLIEDRSPVVEWVRGGWSIDLTWADLDRYLVAEEITVSEGGVVSGTWIVDLN